MKSEAKNQLRAEAEVKVQFKKEELKKVLNFLSSFHFKFQQEQKILDFYIQKKKSSLGGWDFTRLRSINDNKFLITKKIWQRREGVPGKIRIEKESEITRSLFKKKLINKENFVKIEKARTIFKGEINKEEASAVIDLLKIKDEMFYFLEIEILTRPEESSQKRRKIKQFLSGLGLKNKKEAPSMLDFIQNIYKP